MVRRALQTRVGQHFYREDMREKQGGYLPIAYGVALFGKASLIVYNCLSFSFNFLVLNHL